MVVPHSLRPLLVHHRHRYVGVVDLFEVLLGGEAGSCGQLRTSLLDGVVAADAVLTLRCVRCSGLLYTGMLRHSGVDGEVMLFPTEGT